MLYAYAKDGLFFKVFKQMDPVTKIPVKGSWLTCIAVCAVCFFLNLEELSKIISLGNLLNFSFVNAGVIALRFRPPQSANSPIETSSNERFAWLFTIVAFVFSQSLSQYSLTSPITLSLLVLTCGMIIFLSRLPQVNKPVASYALPWFPLIPCLGIIGNFILASKIDSASWKFFFVYCILGVVFYVSYGIKHSKLNKRYNKSNNNASKKLSYAFNN